jgi:ribosomal protein S18 acetylase RimI-like enzyme
MGVSPGHQRRGLGTSLLGEVLLRARAGGAEAVWCDARQSAVGFYMRFGGIVLGERYADEVTGLADRRVIFELGDRAAVFP